MTSKSKNKKKPLQRTLGKAPRSAAVKSIDLSHIRKPIETSLFGLNQVLGLFDTATDEVRRYISFECDIIYECRVCRTIFRSLANFILHKREYCKDHFEDYQHKHSKEYGHNILHSDQSDDSDSTKNSGLRRSLRPTTCKKDLNSVLDKLKGAQESKIIQQKAINNETDESDDEAIKESGIALQKIDDSVAGVFQTFVKNVPKQSTNEFIKSEVMEIHSILNSDEVILGPDGKIIARPILSNDVFNLVCDMCNQRFSTKKTLKHHIKYKHNNNKVVYVCPEYGCKGNNTFANTWGVFRHLFKVHRKSTAQVKRLRTQVQNSVIKRNNVSENRLNVPKNIEKDKHHWIDPVEGDCDFHLCGDCGKKFDRKAAFQAHEQFCLKIISSDTPASTIKSVEDLEEPETTPETCKNHEYPIIDNCAESSVIHTDILINALEENVLIPDESVQNNDLDLETQNIDPIEDTQIDEKEDTQIDEKEDTQIDEKEDTQIDEKEDTFSKYEHEDHSEYVNRIAIELFVKEDPILEEYSKNVIHTKPDVNLLETQTETDVRNEEVPLSVAKTLGKIKKPRKRKPKKNSLQDLSTENVNNIEIKTMDDIITVTPYTEVVVVEDCFKNDLSDDDQLYIDTSIESSSSEDNLKQINETLVDNSKEECKKAKENGCVIQKLKIKIKETNSRRASVVYEIVDNSVDENVKEISLESKALPYIDLNKCSCKPCKFDFKNKDLLMKHMSTHFKWFQFKCKLCLFKSFDKKTCEQHLHKLHALEDNLEQSILAIPQNEIVNNSNDFQELNYTLLISDDGNDNVETVRKDRRRTLSESNTSEDVNKNVQDPSIKKMIMEVIFGSSSNPNVNSDTYSRPVRNRVTPVFKDFVYDTKFMSKKSTKCPPKKRRLSEDV